jgi:hypothetical protein
MPASSAGFHFIQDYKRCQRYWFHKYVNKLEPNTKSPALIFGESGHEALEDYYQSVIDKVPYHERGPIMKERFIKAIEERRDMYSYLDRYEEDLERASIISDAYALQYASEYMQPVAIEESLEVPLPNGQYFTGRVDLVVKTMQGQNYIMDHKFTGWSLNSFAKTVQNSDQATAYLMLWNETHPELQLSGVIFNIIREYKGNVNFLRPIVTKTKGDLEEFKLDLMDTQNDIVKRVLDPEARWPKHTESCFLYNRPCPFLDLCKGQNYEGLIDLKYTKRQGEDNE